MQPNAAAQSEKMQSWDCLLTNIHLATMDGPGFAPLHDGALAIAAGRIAWLGPAVEAPLVGRWRAAVDGGGQWLLPGLVDCHTHLPFAGTRADEFARRLAGESYADIARAGGGIKATVAAVAAADVESLAALARPRLATLMAEGVTTLEAKSGYGLTLAAELTQLRAIAHLARTTPGIDIHATFLGLHAVPAGMEADTYTDQVIGEALPAVAGEALATAADGFCESIAFTPAQVDRYFTAARALGLDVKLHADQLSNLGGAALAARHGALSADHLEYADDAGIAAMADAGTVAVLLPAAFLMLRERQAPPVAALRAAGVPMALATDLNPGSAPALSLLMMLNLGCCLYGLTPAEAVAGVTLHAAAALGLKDRGRLAPGLRADLALWPVDDPAELAYWMGGLRPTRVWQAGAPRADIASHHHP